ncbi:MAG: phage tail sheath family protein [Vicinamibacterales bacterium]
MPVYETPGVYYERADARTPVIAAVRTDVAGFVGLAPRGPVDQAVPVESFRQFQAHFGPFSGSAFLAYAVRGFFENGGRRCWITRVASREPGAGHQTAQAMFRSPGPSPLDVWRVRASSPGVWGNNLQVRFVTTHAAQTLSSPADSTARASTVSSVAGFHRGTLVRIRQGTREVLKVVSCVDPVESTLAWVNEDAEARLPYDTPLSFDPLNGFNPDQPLLIESIEYTLTVRQSGVLVFLSEGLSVVPEHPRYGPAILRKPVNPADLQWTGALPSTPNPVVIKAVKRDFSTIVELDVPEQYVRLRGGADGLSALTTYDFIGEPVSLLDSDEAACLKRRGLQALAAVGEVAIVAIPDIHIRPIAPPLKAPPPACIPDPCLPLPEPVSEPFTEELSTELPPVFSLDDIFRVQAAMVAMCEERRDRIAVLDAPFAAAGDETLGPAVIRNWRSRFDSTYAALYYPWIRVSDPLRSAFGLTRDIPPSGHVIGQYARGDFEVGVHKAPANAPLVWTQDVTATVPAPSHGLLNSMGVNVLLALAGRGVRVMGARTMSTDSPRLYVNVRRLLMMIQKAIYLSTQWAVFEPNDWPTRAKIRLSIISFLAELWQRGALAGATADAAFTVRCDETNNPPDARANGRLLADVGVAPSVPFEFVVLRVGRQANEFEIQELHRMGGL